MTYTGTHQGEFVGIPATGKQTTTNGADFFRMQDDKQAEHWGWAGHVQLPGAAGRYAWPSHARARRACLGAVANGSQPPVP